MPFVVRESAVAWSRSAMIYRERSCLVALCNDIQCRCLHARANTRFSEDPLIRKVEVRVTPLKTTTLMVSSQHSDSHSRCVACGHESTLYNTNKLSCHRLKLLCRGCRKGRVGSVNSSLPKRVYCTWKVICDGGGEFVSTPPPNVGKQLRTSS